ncbi:MAG: alpha/beta hydrolase family esterase [Paracoccaceae bacterium]
MTRHFAAAMRRATKLMRPARMKKAGSVQKAMTGLMVKAMLSALPDPTPKKATPAKVATRKPRVVKTAGSLGTVVAKLRTASMNRTGTGKAGAGRSQARSETPPIHRSGGASRSYRIHMPKDHAKEPKGLLLMLHGCSQTIDDFALGTGMNRHADKHGLIVVYVEQTSVDNAAACWNWFRPDNQVRGGGEPALLASLTRKIMKEHGLTRDSVFVAGLSAGGAMAAILADVYPDVFAAAGIHSGLPRGAARDVMSAMSAMRSGGAVMPAATRPPHPGLATRRIIFHGDKDSTVHPSNAAAIVAGAIGDTALPHRVTRRSVRGRSYARSDFADADGQIQLELWTIEGSGHAWSGGKAAGSYTDAKGPDASAQMIRFFVGSSA